MGALSEPHPFGLFVEGKVNEDRIRLKHIDVPISFIQAQCYAKQGDIVIVSGTLVEGIGNNCSDIDVYVIANSYPKRQDIVVRDHHRVLSIDREIVRDDTPGDTDVFLIHTVLPGTSVKVDVEFKTFAEINAIFNLVRDIFLYARRNLFLLTKRITDREEVLLHRFLNCLVISGSNEFKKILQELPRQELIYIGYRWIASDFNILLDLIGAWRAGEIDRAVEFARENVFIQTSAYLRLTGCTNFRRKWLLSYLRRSCDPQLVSEFFELMYICEAGDHQAKISYVFKALDYIDKIFVYSRPFLEAIEDVPFGQEALNRLRHEFEQSPMHNTYKDWEFFYRSRAYRDEKIPTHTILGQFGSSFDAIIT